jgi:hypothetical protein
MSDTEYRLLAAIKKRGVLMYKTEVLIPTVKKLLDQCVAVESQLVTKRSVACHNCRYLRIEIADLLDSLNTEEHEDDERQ